MANPIAPPAYSSFRSKTAVSTSTTGDYFLKRGVHTIAIVRTNISRSTPVSKDERRMDEGWTKDERKTGIKATVKVR